MFHGPHFETRTHDARLLGIKKRSALRALLATVAAIVVILTLGSFDLPAYPSGPNTRFVATDQLTSQRSDIGEATRQSVPRSERQPHQRRGLPTNDARPTAGLGQVAPKGSSAGKPAGLSREDVEGRVTALHRGELLLSVPRLGIRDVRVPSGSSQAKLDKEGIIRLTASGLPSSVGSNTYIVGHRIGFSQTRLPYVFYKFDKLRPRDKILVEDHSGTKYVYEVYDHRTVPPTHYWLTHPVEGKTIISLQTCTPIPSFEDRLVVRGELVRMSSQQAS